jgi:SAM-dependent methyltransferase
MDPLTERLNKRDLQPGFNDILSGRFRRRHADRVDRRGVPRDIVPDQETMSLMHPSAAVGYQSASKAYERGRPSYPAAAVSCLLDELDINPRSTVVEPGAGTGKFTRLMADRTHSTIAVEPVEGMRRVLRATTPAARAIGGYAESLPLADACADAVVCAQCFHWFDGPAALREIHRVLKPGGRLGLIWTVREEAAPWVKELTYIMDPHGSNVPRYRGGIWKEALKESGQFKLRGERHLEHAHPSTPAEVVDRVGSVSFIAAMGDRARAQLLKQVRQLLDTHPDTRGKDAIVVPYRVDLFWYDRS